MRLKRIAFLLSIIAGAICLPIFFYQIIKKQHREFAIFVAGMFMISLGSSSFYKSGKRPNV